MTICLVFSSKSPQKTLGTDIENIRAKTEKNNNKIKGGHKNDTIKN